MRMFMRFTLSLSVCVRYALNERESIARPDLLDWERAFDLHSLPKSKSTSTVTRRVRMKRHFMFGTVFSAALAVAASAQTPTGQSGSTAGSSSSSGQTVTLTGCLRSGSSSATVRAGRRRVDQTAGSSSASGGGFILERMCPLLVRPPAAPAGRALVRRLAGARGPPVRPAARPAPAAAVRPPAVAAHGYRLTGSLELSGLVGKRVEVTGTMANSSGSIMGSGSSTSGSTGGSATGSTGGSATGSTGGSGRFRDRFDQWSSAWFDV